MNLDHLSELPDWNDRLFLRDDEEDGEKWKPRPTHEACINMYKQWQHVFFLLKGVTEQVVADNDEEDSMLQYTVRDLIRDAMIVGVKIKSSEAGDLFVLRMENASIIRKLAQSIASTILLLTEEGVDEKHIEVVRKEIDKFRQLFIIWVNTFEKDEITDEWGLFV